MPSAAGRRAISAWSAATCRASTPRSSSRTATGSAARQGLAIRHLRQRRVAVTEHKLAHGDRVQFGRASGADVVFLTGDGSVASIDRTPSAVNDLRQLAALLEGLRALGSGRVLDEVLALVLDAAIDVTGAERGFIMLAPKVDAEASSK